MAASANTVTRFRDGNRADYPVAATTKLYQNQLTFLDSSGNLTGSTNSGANKFAGVNVEEVDNSNGSAGDERAQVYTSGAVEMTGSGFTAADVGRDVYATDSNTITLTAAGGVRIGKVLQVESATRIWVRLAVGTVLTPYTPTAAAEAKSGAGAINVTSYYTALTSTGAQANTLADGTVQGQLKKIQMVVDGGDATLTPAHLSGASTTITFADVGDFVILMWDGSAWVVLEAGNAVDGATAPAIA